ncbi:MAG: putative porin [candidate division KSB1 bacterium]|nr:putative porin [candidate division KSB1 bacterium]MDZ7300679.1 putative porin [candidate division KSB1 bacterium]MDZ7309815.1 putative porin [candidate division KSB1 bacterium]
MNQTYKLIAMCCCSKGLLSRPVNILLAALALFVAPSWDVLHAQTNPLNFSGDFRVRHERTTKQEPGATPDIRDPRNREVVRFRFGMSKKINELFNFGARLATGSPDDPNTTDITLGDFVNDLTISLDRVYMELNYKNLFLTGGKFANPFHSTELVWDGDVNPQGFGASYTFSGFGKIIPKLTGVYYVVDEQTTNPDSYMLGGQLQFSVNASSNLSLTLAGAYYDYSIKSLTHADPSGDILSNFLTADKKAYLSDFDLVDAVVTINYRGFGERYPLRLVGDFVKNRGAALGEDEGHGVDLYLGKVSKKNDWRFQYGYALVENDAVLAAFSHDNTTLATNYEQHTLAIDYVVHDNTILNVTLYHYRRHHFPSAISLENDFFTRLRLNALVNF